MRLTRDDLENAADDEDVVWLDADEEQKQDHAEDDDDHRETDEDGRCLERRRQNAVEITQRAVADALSAEVDELAQLIRTHTCSNRTVIK